MNWVFASIIGLAAGQVIVCGMSLGLLISIVGRIIYLLRAVIVVVPCKVSVWMEGLDFLLLIMGVVFKGPGANWGHVLFSMAFIGTTLLLYKIDTTYNLYVEEDDEDEAD